MYKKIVLMTAVFVILSGCEEAQRKPEQVQYILPVTQTCYDGEMVYGSKGWYIKTMGPEIPCKNGGKQVPLTFVRFERDQKGGGCAYTVSRSILYPDGLDPENLVLYGKCPKLK
jgi:hypothetical protein